MDFKLEGEEFILLQSLLKASGLCDTGGEAKNVVKDGQVKVDGVVETRRGKKVIAGQTVSYNGKAVKVTA